MNQLKVYVPLKSVIITSERMKELLKEGRALAKEARKRWEKAAWITAEDYSFRVK